LNTLCLAIEKEIARRNGRKTGATGGQHESRPTEGKRGQIADKEARPTEAVKQSSGFWIGKKTRGHIGNRHGGVQKGTAKKRAAYWNEESLLILKTPAVRQLTCVRGEKERGKKSRTEFQTGGEVNLVNEGDPGGPRQDAVGLKKGPGKAGLLAIEKIRGGNESGTGRKQIHLKFGG